MSDNVFFGLVRKKVTNPLAGMYSFGDDPTYDLYLVNDSDSPITVKRKAYGGFKTHEDIMAIAKPQDDDVNIAIEPHSHILYTELYDDTFNGDAGASHYQAIIDIEGSIKMLEITFSRGAGMLGTLIPCVNQYGRIVKPRIKDITGGQ